MRNLNELRLSSRLLCLVQECQAPHGLSEKAITDFYKEKLFLISQFKELHEDDAWWSAQEWEWFLNRCLDFLGAKP